MPGINRDPLTPGYRMCILRLYVGKSEVRIKYKVPFTKDQRSKKKEESRQGMRLKNWMECGEIITGNEVRQEEEE